MDYDKMDKIHIRDLLIRTVIGIYPEERNIRQDLLINLTLYTNQRPAADSDDYNLTVDYQIVQESVIKMVEASSFGLIESLASAIAELLLKVEGVTACRIVVDKLGVLRFSRSVAVEIFREKNRNNLQ